MESRDITDAERRILGSLAWMCEQYLTNNNDDLLDHKFMSAGEGAIELLVEYGFVEPRPRGGIWTKTGRELLDSY